jgi:hypothetical protein
MKYHQSLNGERMRGENIQPREEESVMFVENYN